MKNKIWIVGIMCFQIGCAFKEPTPPSPASAPVPVASNAPEDSVPQPAEESPPVAQPEPEVPPPSQPVAQPQPSPQPSPQPKPLPSVEPEKPKPAQIDPKLELFFSKQSSAPTQSGIKRALSLDKAFGFVTRVIVHLPVQAPEAITLHLSLPGSQEGGTVNLRAAWKSAIDSPPSQEAQISGIDVSETYQAGIVTSVQVEGLNGIFPTDQERLQYLEISFLKAKGEVSAKVLIPFLTPPSRLSSEHVTLVDWQSQHGEMPAEYKELKSPGLELVLMQVVTVKSQATNSVTLSLPYMFNGRISTRFSKTEASNGNCTHSVSNRTWDEEVAKGFYLLPLEAGLPSSFRTVISEASSLGWINRNLDPSQEMRVGVYAAGDPAFAVMRGSYPRTSKSGFEGVTSCQYRCRGNGFFWNNRINGNFGAGIYWKSRGYPGESQKCDQLDGMPRGDGFNVPHPQESLVLACAQWELANGLSPWDEHRFCRSSPPGNPWGHGVGEFWLKQNHTTVISVGLDAEPVWFDGGEAPYMARFVSTEQPEPAQRGLPSLTVGRLKQLD